MSSSEGVPAAPSGFDPSRIALLSRDQIDLLAMCPVERSFVAADVPWSRPGPTGNALNRLAERGLVIQASDPEKWGRSRYIADSDAVAQAIEARRAATTKIGAVEDESAVGNADAPNPSRGSPHG